MKALKIAPFVICILLVSQLNAQTGKVKMDIQYSYALPLGSFKNDVINNSSPRGVTGDILYNLNNKLSLGLGLGFQDFYQKYPRDVYKTGGNESTSAVLSNSVQIIPVLAKAEFYPLEGKKSPVQPYITAGAGLGITSFTQYLGEFGGTDNSASFMLQGGAGVIVPFSQRGTSGFKLGANYNMVSYKKNGFNNFDNLNVQAGLFFPLK
ncbi:MAG: outer membrane beta-barrel protein [Parafilimonas sp.]